MFKFRSFLTLFLFSTLCVASAHGQQNRYIVRVLGGLNVIQNVCGLLNCSVVENLDGSAGQVFLVTPSGPVDPNAFLNGLVGQSGILNVELDQVAKVSDSSPAVPAALTDKTPVSYYGSTVISGYLHQPATSLVSLSQAQSNFHVSGAGIVAVIDTGVDATHPVLKNVLLPGYDFTRNTPGSDETLDLQLASAPFMADQPSRTNDRSVALVDQSTAAVIDGNGGQYTDFGHGTMVAGVIHLTAPTAQILPLKAFHADGTGYNSDILRAIYYAIGQNASVLNMSFNLAGYSQEIKTALALASLNGIVSVAASGNQGNDTPLYPASYPNVISVASTSNTDQLSSFSSYGDSVWIGSPGEGVVTTYPYGTYAAAWGTSFSAPFVSGTVALMRGMQPFCNQQQSARALSNADRIQARIGNGRLDISKAIQAWGATMGLPFFPF